MDQNIVVITGVARGLGRSLVEAFACDGTYVCGVARSEDGLE